MQGKNELERHYEREDPWGVQQSVDDINRKKLLCYIAEMFAPCLNGYPCYPSAIDIAAGEGWVTQGLPAVERYALELSDNAASRFPYGVRRAMHIDRTYDLVTCFGALYSHYFLDNLVTLIRAAAQPGGIVLVSYIAQWEVPSAIESLSKGWEQLFTAEFPYSVPGPGMAQRVRVWRVK